MIPKNKKDVFMYAQEAGKYLGGDHHIISRLVKKGDLVPVRLHPMMFWTEHIKDMKKKLDAMKKIKAVKAQPKPQGKTRVYDTEDLGLDCDKCQALFDRLEQIEKRLSYLEARK